MTNKEELREKWIKKCSIATKGEGKHIYSFGLHEDCADPEDIFDFFWNEIEQIRKEDMERVEQQIKTYWEDYNYDEICLGGVLDIIKQSYE